MCVVCVIYVCVIETETDKKTERGMFVEIKEKRERKVGER